MPDIGHSARRALGQFRHNEDKLSKNENARKQYVDFFEEMIETGHLEKVPETENYLPAGKYYVMPHHAV